MGDNLELAIAMEAWAMIFNQYSQRETSHSTSDIEELIELWKKSERKN